MAQVNLISDQLDADALAKIILRHASESRNEEDLKIRIESTLRTLLDKWTIQWASYERRLEFSGREDALYGRVIIEYKSPGRLKASAEFQKAKEQVKEYIVTESQDKASRSRYFGVILDGFQISFIRFRKGAWDEQAEPLPVNGQTILRLLESIRGLKRKPLDAEFLLVDFGPRSEISQRTIRTLYEAIADKNTARTDMLFADWRRVFSQVCSYSKDKFAGLVEYYSLEKETDVEKLLFAVHTYYTMLMKLLTSEIVALFTDSLLGSYLKRIEEAYYRGQAEMLTELKDLEEGGIFKVVGIRNFLEADYFAWYIDEWNPDIAKSFFELTSKLLDYEPATVEIVPERVEDLFKQLYQNLVPRDVRHSIGEYFTPDWLAELLIEQVEYDGDPDKKVLDPSCGSGTFLVLAIKKIKEFAEDHFQDERALLGKIVKNVQGIDLNPLAVLAAKANYLIALSQLIRYRPKEGIEIPIYLADSISVVRRADLTRDEYELFTNEGKFWVAKEVIDKKLLYPLLSIVSEDVKISLTEEQFEESINKKIPISFHSLKSFVRLYKKILNLEQVGKNRIWTSLLKNSFSPMLIGKFDFVIGNPPWINWETLPEFYRESTKPLWERYGLLETTMGGMKRDISMLFVLRCLELYCQDNGKLGFLIPFTLFKTKSGLGFRKSLADNYVVLKAADLVELYPFEGATNRTALIVVGQGRSKFPIPCRMWMNPSGRAIGQDMMLDQVVESTKSYKTILTPINEKLRGSAWMEINPEIYELIKGVLQPSSYKGYAGTYSGMDGIYDVWIIKDEGDRVLAENLAKTARKQVRKVTTQLESDLLYPLVRGKDAKRWYSRPELKIIVPHDKNTSNVIPESKLKVNFPLTYKYFLSFKDILRNRTIKPFLGKKNSLPFYLLDNMGIRTFSEYKVAWKKISGRISGKAELNAFVVSPIKAGKTVMLTEGLMFIPIDDRDEAHYVCAVLNSSVAYLIAMSYSLEVHITTDVTEYIHVPDYDPGNKIHKKLAELSEAAHDLATEYFEKKSLTAKQELSRTESDIDSTVGQLYGLTKVQLNEINRNLEILEKGQIDIEEALDDSSTVP
jgi:hypothetical protein